MLAFYFNEQNDCCSNTSIQTESSAKDALGRLLTFDLP